MFRGVLWIQLISVSCASLACGRFGSLLGFAEATEKDLDFEILLNTAVDFRKWLRFPREGA
ncbi:hypothetical protein AAV98_17275 [Bacillus sp. CHD6a]|nr:hypothetical protein AAV98_17275 [Bacillus sp. CHD6a]